MLESIVAGILSKYLGDFIVGLESENLSLNISGGHVVLENLQIKKECLAELELPITVKEGYLGKFSLEIPWSSLGSKPAVAIIERVYLLAGPTNTADYNVNLVKKKQIETKKRKLQVNELLASDPTKEEKQPILEGEEKLSYTQKLIRTVVDNFQVFVKKVHFRYEDDVSNPGRKFAIGATIESFQAESCDENWLPQFLKSEARKFVHKIANLKNFAVYFSSDCDFVESHSVKALGKAMENLIFEEGKKNDATVQRDYILHPINGELKIQLNQKQHDFNVPKLIAQLAFDSVIGQLKERQFQNLIYMGNYFTYYIRGVKYHEFRPDRRVKAAKEPLKWWAFGLKSVLKEVREKRARKTWKRLSKHKRDRLLYVTLYKKKLIQKKKASEIVLDTLASMENSLEYEDIILFRALTDAWIRKELREKRLQLEKQGWFGGWFHKKDEDIHTMEEISFNDWRDLYKDINFLEEPVEDVVPPDYIKMKASFAVGEGSFELIGDDPRNNEGALGEDGECKVIQAGFEGFHVDVEQRPKGESVRASLLSVAVVDHFTLAKESESVEMVSLNDAQLSQSTHFFTIEFDRNPLDSNADMRVHLAALQSLNITFGMEIINRIVKFFNHQANANQLKLAANNTWDSLKESAEVQVKYALDKRKVLEVSVDVVAPNVMIPAGFTDPKASMLVIELGTLSVRSDNNNRQNAITRSGRDIQAVNRDFYYDKFQVKISSIHVLIADRSYSQNSKLNPLDIDLVQKFDIDVDLFLCTVTSSDLPKLRLSGRLPKLMALISPIKIGRLFSILRSLSTAQNVDTIKQIDDDVHQHFSYKDFNDEKAKLLKAQKIDTEKKMDNLISVDFTFSDLLLEVHRDIAVNQFDDRQLILLQIHQFRLLFSKTSDYLSALLTLHSLNILDFIQQYSDRLYLVQSKGSADSDNLVSIKYTGIPKTSPKFEKIEHNFEIQFNILEVQVNRETIASLLTYTNLVLEKMKDPAQAEAIAASPQPEKHSEKLAIAQIAQFQVDSILVQAHIQIGGLKATLLKGGQPFVVSSLTNSVVRAHLHSNNEIKLSGHLGNIAVYDYSKDTLWEEIVVNTGDSRILEFWFETVNPDVHNDSLGKVIITLQISSVRFIFLSKFLKSLASYMTELSEMQTILSKTAKKAKEKAEDVKASSLSKLVIFDISVANPQVIIPLKSNENSSYIVGNLGDISITNKFEKGDSGVMVDLIGLKISDISMFSVHRDKEPKKRDIIENTDIYLNIYRAAFWNDQHHFPDITANVKIRKIALKLCELQLQLLVGILGGNLAELPDQSANDLEKFKNRLPTSKDDDHKRLELSESSLLLDFIKYKFALELGQTSLEILEGDGYLADGSDSSLVKLSIDDLSTQGSISESTQLQAKLLIGSISISDTRPNIDNHFKKLLTSYKKENPNLIKLKFVKEPTGNQTAVIVVNSPRILLLPDLLFKFKDVAMNNLNYFNKSMEEIKKKNNEGKEKEEEKTEEEEAKGEKSNPTGLHAKLTIIDPQVCLIENIKEKDSRLLVLKQSLEVDYTMNSSGVQYANVNITSIQLYKSRIETENPIQILTPFNMKISYELMPKEIMSILIDFDPIDLKISYSDFKLLMIIKNNWMEALPKPEKLAIESNEVVDKFRLKKREPKKEIVLHNEHEDKKKREANNLILSETLRIAFNKIKLLLLNDCYEGATNTPLLDLALDQMDAQLLNWSTELRGQFNLTSMKAFYYNSSENTNEPMIEPWDFNGSFFKGEDGCFNAKLVAPDILNMNITKSFIESLLNNLEQWQLDYYDKATSERPILHPYYIVNQTGLTLTYWITGTQKRISIESGVETPLDISELHSNRDHVDQEFMISLQLEADDLIPVHNLPVFKKTTMIFDLTLKNNIKLLYTIEFRQGSRVLIFGSDFSFVNSTNSPLDVLIEHKDLPPLSFDRLAPSQKRYVPLRYANQSTIRFKPSDQPFKWSMEVINSSNLKREAIPMLITCPSEAPSTPNWLYSVDIKGEREQKGKQSKEGKEIVFTLVAPLKLENTLPEKLNYIVKGGSSEELASGHLEAGENVEIFHVQKDSRPKLFLNIGGFLWSAMNKIGATAVMVCQIESKTKRILSLGIDNVTTPFGSRSAAVFVKYWLYNQTSEKLKYKNAKLLNLNNNKSIAGDSEIVASKSIPHSVSNFNISDSDSALLSSSDHPFYDLGQPELRCIKPFIFSGDVLSLRNNSSAWSSSVSLKSNGGVIEALNLNDRKMADPLHSQLFSVLVQSAPGRYYRSSIVKITPHYIFINKTNFTLEVRQKGCAKFPQLIYHSDQTLFNWHRRDLEKFLEFTFDGDDFDWSAPFSIDSANSFQVPIWKKPDPKPIYVRITVNITGTSVTVLFLCSDDDFPDYRIENYSSHSINVSELGESTSFRIEGEQFIPFAWKSPLSPKKQIVITIPRTTIEAHVSLDKLHLYPYLAWPNINGQFQYLSVEVIADGPTKVLQIDELSPDDVPEYDQKIYLADLNSQSDRKLELKQEEYSKVDIKTLFNIVMEFKEIGFSIIDEKPQELLYLNLRVIKLLFSLLEGTQSLELSVENMQIDNQLYHTQYPIFFYSAPVEGQPFFQLSLLRSEKYPNILYFPYFGVKLQKFEVQLDEIFLLRMLNFVEILTKFLASRKVEEEEAELFRTSPSYHLTSNSSQIQSSMLYFDILHINPLMMTITFSAVGGRDQDISGGMLEKTLRAGGFLASIDNAPLRLNGLILENPFISQSQLISRIIQHYTQQGLREFYLLLGSADVLGNPVSLVSNLGTGVYDFFHEPAEGIVNSPQDFAIGVARGTKSLVKNSVFGVFNSASKISGTISKAAATISLDDDWQRSRAKKMSNKPQHLGQGLKKGVKDLGTGVFEGVTGIVSQPLRGFNKEGGIGLVKGVGKGVTGLFLRPVVGVVDFITDTTEGIKNSAVYFDEKKHRIRPPRFIGPDRIVGLFDAEKSWGQLILRTIDNAAYDSQFLVDIIEMAEEKYLIISDKLVLVLLIKGKNSINRRARFALNEISGVERGEGGVILNLTTAEKSIMLECDPQTAPTVAETLRKFATKTPAKAHVMAEYHRLEDPKMIAKFSNANLDQSGSNSNIIINEVAKPEEEDVKKSNEKSPLVAPRASLPTQNKNPNPNSARRNTEKQPLLKQPPRNPNQPPRKKPPQDDSCCCCCIS